MSCAGSSPPAGRPGRCVFAGVGKSEREIEFALRRGIYCFNVESNPELVRINRVAARLGKIAPVAVRLNPNIDAHTHAKITTGTYQNKFGIPFERVEEACARAARLKNLRLRGLQMHIGSQLTKAEPFEAAVKKVIPLARKLAARHGLEFLSIGGGLGIVYHPPWPAALPHGGNRRLPAASHPGRLRRPAWRRCSNLSGLKILIEPGRFIVGNAGILVTRVENVKKTGVKKFVIVDAAMNDLIRPAFYDAFHEIVPVSRHTNLLVSSDVVGPICESGDYFCRDRPLPKVRAGDYLALISAGAYGFVMASNYNSRPLAAEVLVNGARSAVIRRRQRLPETLGRRNLPRLAAVRAAL